MTLSDTILSPTEVAGNLSRSIVLDCRFSLADPSEGERLYHEGHLPGAFYCHLDNDLSGEKEQHGGRHPLPAPTVWLHQLQSWGIHAGTPVIVYDDSRFAFAARAWWLLRQAGVQQVHLMDGGFSAWCRAGLPVDRRTPRLKLVGPHTNLHWQPQAVASIEQVKTLSGQPGVLIDSREAPRYRGDIEPIDPVAGHIPGADNLPWGEITDSDGAIRPTAFHRERWAPYLGTTPIVYCGSGVTACVNLLSAHLAEQPVALYPGSWSDWCSYPELPVAKGTEGASAEPS